MGVFTGVLRTPAEGNISDILAVDPTPGAVLVRRTVPITPATRDSLTVARLELHRARWRGIYPPLVATVADSANPYGGDEVLAVLGTHGSQVMRHGAGGSGWCPGPDPDRPGSGAMCGPFPGPVGALRAPADSYRASSRQSPGRGRASDHAATATAWMIRSPVRYARCRNHQLSGSRRTPPVHQQAS